MLGKVFVPVSEEKREEELEKIFKKSQHESLTEYGNKVLDFLGHHYINKDSLPGFEYVGDYVIKDFINSRSKQLYNTLFNLINRVMIVHLGINDESFVKNSLKNEFAFANLDFILDVIKKTKEVKGEQVYYLINSIAFGFANNLLYDISVYNAKENKFETMDLFFILDDITLHVADLITEFIYDLIVYTLCYHESLGILL